MNRNFYKIVLIFSLIISSGKNFYSQNPAACNNLVNLCTNSVFSFSANSGTGLTAGLNISNPFTNPQAVNVGCMFTNVANPQWLLLNITTTGNLGFSFGAFGSSFPQAGNYDWIMWPYSSTACNDIFNNILPPVACNWNCTGGGGTGMGTVPSGGSPCNFQPSIPVVQGQQYIILITNPSGVNTPVSFSMTGSAAVSCNPILFDNQTACPGQQAVFTGTWVNSSGGSYTLQPGNVVQTNPSFTVSSLTTQVYTVTAQGTNLSAIPIADQTTFTLNINPIIPISITTPTNYCYGSNATFTVSPAGTGTFNVTGPSAPTTSFATTSIAYPNVTTPNIGTFTVAASYTNGCTGTQTTQVNVAPNHTITVSSNTNVCMNGTVNLTSSMPTATAYAWTGPNGFNSVAQNPVLNTMQPVESGVYTVTSNINFNGITCPRSNTVQVSVVATSPVTVTPTFTLCQGSNLNLVSNATGAVSHSWNGPAAYSSSAQNPVVPGILPSGAGNYSATAYFTNGPLTCTTGAVSNVSVVATSPVSMIVPAHICQNATANMTVNAPGATGFTWTGPNAFTSTSASQSIPLVQPAASGIYSATAMFSIGSVSCSTSNTSSMSVVATSTVAVIPNFTVCQGSGLNLISNATGAASYSWSGPGAYTSAVQNPLLTSILPSAAGNYSVTASFTDGVLTCTTGAVTNVSVVATSPVTLTVPAHICQNATANMNVVATGATGFSWTGPNAFTSTSASPSIPLVQPAASGIYSATAMFSIGSVSCTTSNTSSMSVVVTSTVAAATNFTVCQGSNVNLTSNATGAASYSWSGPGAYSSTLQNPTLPSVLPAAAGDYTATASFTDGVLTCTTNAIANVLVVATSPVTLTVPTHICQNATANMNAIATGATAFTWTGPNAFTSTSASPSIPVVQPAASGIYSATAMFSIGTVSCTTSNTSSMSVVATSTVAVIPNFTVCQGSGLNLISNATGAASYSWSGPGAYTSAVQNPLLTSILPSAAGNYSVTASFTDGVLTCTTGAVTNVSVVATSPVTLTVPAHICQNATANMNVVATGATGFSWTGPNAFTSTSASPSIPLVQPAASGIYSATAMFSIGSVSCTTSNTSSMSVVATSTVAVIPNFTVCQGSGLNLISNASGAASYSWSGPGAYTSAVQNPLLTSILPSSAGNYSVTASFTDGVLTCTTGAVTNVSVVATSPVTLTVPAHICQNATANMNAVATGATGFSWTGPNAFTSTSASPGIPLVQPAASGIYSATAMFSIGSVSCTTSNTSSMSVVATNTVAAATNFTVCQSSNVNLTSNASGAASYSWSGPGSYSSTLQNPTLTSVLPAAAGDYTATALFTDGVLTCTTNAIANVSVVATPTTTITYPANICQNNTANFTASSPGAISYTWTGPNSFSSTSANPSIPGIQTNGSGIYTTTTMFAIGSVSCTTNVTNSLSVIGTNTVSVSPDFTICAGGNVNLTSNASGAVSYSWNGPGGYSSPQQNPTITGIVQTGTGIYTATAFFTNGSFTCTTSATLNGSVIAIPPLTVTATSTVICATENTTLTASGSLNYTWTPAATLNTGNGPTVIASPLVPTLYSITAADASGCLKSNTISILVNPQPTLTATSNTMCFGTSASLTVSGATAYTWTPSATINNPNAATVTATPPVNTIYTVTGSSNKGCLNTTTASVIVKPLPVLSTADHTICIGKSANLSVTGATNYTWTPAVTLNTATQPNVIATPTQNTTYSVTGEDLNGCKSVTASIVIVNPLPVISTTSSGTICAGQSGSVSASGANTYTWNNGPQSSTQFVSPVTPTTYTVTGMDVNGCVNTNTVFLDVLIQPTLNITGSPTVCLGNMITLTASGGPDYSWDNGETTNIITVEPQSNTTYTVSSGVAPCNSSTVFAVTVYTPQVPASYADPSTIIYGASSVIHANVPAGYPFTWTSPDINCTSCEANTVTPAGTTVYSLTVTDSQGCTFTNTVLVTVDIICGEIFVPSAFSPNNDGFNDFLCVYSNCITSMNLQIYNRWGEKVFESGDKNNCWDGSHNGVLQNDAVFIYQLTGDLINGEKIIKKGNITLKR